MELIKPEIARYAYKDVVFLVRTRANAGDKFAMEQTDIGRLVVEGGKAIRKVDAVVWGKFLVRQFVCGWEGVTDPDTKQPAAYSYETFEACFPADPDDVLWTKLAAFIASRVDIFTKGASEIKNASPAQPDGSRGPNPDSAAPDRTPSPAAAATA